MCLEQIPSPEVKAKEREFEAHGWVWVEHTPARIVLVKKDFYDPVSERAIEQEIKDLMGDAYATLAAPGSPRDLDSKSVGESASQQQNRLAAKGAQVSKSIEIIDAEGHIHGSTQVVRRDEES